MLLFCNYIKYGTSARIIFLISKEHHCNKIFLPLLQAHIFMWPFRSHKDMYIKIFSFSHVAYLQYSIDHDTMSFPLSSCSSFSWSLLIRYFVANFYNVLEKHLWILEQIIMNDDVLLDKGRISTSCKQTNSCCTKTWFSWGYHARWEFAINSCWYCSNETSLHQWPFTSRDLIVNSPLQLVHISL